MYVGISKFIIHARCVDFAAPYGFAGLTRCLFWLLEESAVQRRPSFRLHILASTKEEGLIRKYLGTEICQNGWAGKRVFQSQGEAESRTRLLCVSSVSKNEVNF